MSSFNCLVPCCDCCLTPGEIPFSQIKLISPYENCSGYGPPPDYPILSLNQGAEDNCCFYAGLLFFCQPETKSCKLWAKRKTDWGYTVKYYRQLTKYLPLGSTVEDCGTCDCILNQTRTVSATTTSRVFFGHKHQLKEITITVGKTFIKCEQDEVPVCKYFIAVTYTYSVAEGMSSLVGYRKADYTCVGNFQNNNCSVTSSWTTELGGPDSDSCPDDSIISWGAGSQVKITRAKFYNTLPTGTVTIGKDDTVPFSCCDGKTSCELRSSACGLVIGQDRCYPPIPAYPEGQHNYSPVLDYCSPPSSGSVTGPLWWDENNQPHCMEIHVNGVSTPATIHSNCYVGPLEGYNCYTIINPNDNTGACTGTSIGIDRFWTSASAPTNTGIEGYTMCLTLGDFIPQIGMVADCLHGSPTPEVGLCEIPDCCIVVFPTGGFPYTHNCNYFESPSICGRKISNYSCNTQKTDYSVGDFCFELPNVVMELS